MIAPSLPESADVPISGPGVHAVPAAELAPIDSLVGPLERRGTVSPKADLIGMAAITAALGLVVWLLAHTTSRRKPHLAPRLRHRRDPQQTPLPSALVCGATAQRLVYAASPYQYRPPAFFTVALRDGARIKALVFGGYVLAPVGGPSLDARDAASVEAVEL